MSNMQFELDWVLEATRRTRMHRYGWGTLGSAAAIIVAALTAQATNARDTPFGAALGFVVIGATLGLLASGGLLMAAAIGAPFNESKTGKLTIDGDRVVIERSKGSRMFSRKDIASGWVDDRDQAHLVLQNGTEYSCAAKDGGTKILDALGLNVGQRTATFAAESGAAGFFPFKIFYVLVAALTGIFAIGAAGQVSMFARGVADARGVIATTVCLAICAALTWVGGRAIGKQLVTVGTDGVRIRGVHTRFIPYSKIERIEDLSWGVTLFFKGGGQHTIHFDMKREQQDRASLKRRIEAAMAARGQADSPEALASALDRGERSLADWKAHLATLLGGDGDYRRARFDTDGLAAIIADASAPAGRRIGAAVALASTGDDSAKQRIRLAADASADESLRVALQRAAEGQIEEEQLAEIEARPRQRSM